MKKIFLFYFVLVTQVANAQFVPSSCTAPDSILIKYKGDADRMVLRKIYRNHLSYMDSIKIPAEFSSIVLKALIAVFNAKTLAARDTVTNIFNIHTFPDIVMNDLYVVADSNLNWMQQLKLRIIPTGNLIIDNLMADYGLKLRSFYPTSSDNFKTVTFKSDSNYNLQPIANLFKLVTGVRYADPDGFCCDGNNIIDSVYNDHVELIYSYGWGDCMAGCINRRYWKFKVDFKCSVEFVTSYGSPLFFTGIIENNLTTVSVGPNPVQGTIFLDGITVPYSYSISNMLGEVLMRGKHLSVNSINAEALYAGIYLLSIQIENKSLTFKILKE